MLAVYMTWGKACQVVMLQVQGSSRVKEFNVYLQLQP